MAAKLVIETRMEGDDKWQTSELFDDFDTCLKHIKNLIQKEGRKVRLVVPGGFNLTAADEKALKELGVEHNS